MKKLAIFGFALIIAIFVACSDESSSSSASMDPVVSCNVSFIADGSETPLLCWQYPEELKDDLKEECGAWNTKIYKTSVSDGACDLSTAKKECLADDDSTFHMSIYDIGWSGFTCDNIFIFMAKEMASLAEEEDDDEDDGEEENQEVSVIAYYNIPEQICAQYNADAFPAPDIDDYVGKHNDLLDITGKGLIRVKNCNEVAKMPVISCTEEKDDDFITVFFYDEKLQEKTCEDLLIVTPEEPEDADSEEENDF